MLGSIGFRDGQGLTTLAPHPWLMEDDMTPDMNLASRLSLSRRRGTPVGPLAKEDWALRLRFASLVLCSQESLAEGLNQVEWDLLGFALLGTAHDVREHLLASLDVRIREVVRVFMSHLTGIPEREVTLAQKLVLEHMSTACAGISTPSNRQH
jgi:hypothetical protein